MDTEQQETARKIVEARDFYNMTSSPAPWEYVVTCMQAGNLRGEQGWHKYIGYVVQVRKKAGAFGSDMVILRHPDGTLMRHENQSFCRMDDLWLEQAKSLFPAGMTPEEYENYTEAYTLGNGEYPEIGKVIESQLDGPPRDDAPIVQITVDRGDGSRELIVC